MFKVKYKWLYIIVIVLLVLLVIFKGEFVLLKSFKGLGKFFYKSSVDLTQKNEDSELKKQLNNLKIENTKLKILQNENEVLRKYLNLKNVDYKVSLANVLNKRKEINIEWYLLDKGERDGVKEGMAVINENGFFVGKINKTENNFSYFLPFSSPYFRISVEILSAKQTQLVLGVLEGEEGLALEINYILHDAEIEKGDKVVTSGLEESINPVKFAQGGAARQSRLFHRVKPGLLIGEIVAVKDDPHQLFKKAVVKPFSQEKNLKIVGIVMPAP